MSGGYALPDGSFQEDVSQTTSVEPLPVDSVCGAADVLISVTDQATATDSTGGE